MKSLIDQVRDLRDTAAILKEMADQLEQLAMFFGGAPVQSPVITTPIKSAEVLKEIIKVDTPKPNPRGGRTKASEGGRPLSPQEKQSIRQDWSTLGEHLRTKENRAALARKYNCSPIQIFALVRDPANFNLKGTKAAHEQKQK